jgi:cysteinyl-tRNA synthetase
VALRLLFLQAHYRSQMNFTWKSLDAAQLFLKRLQAFADLKHQTAANQSGQAAKLYDSAIDKMRLALADDLNSAEALAILSNLTSLAEDNGVDKLQAFLEAVDELLGLDLSKRPDITPQINGLIKQREAARQSKDWDQSDQLRRQLLEQGIEINDTPTGSTWRRV